MNNNALLPCPFCGGEAEIIPFENKKICSFFIECKKCSCRKGWFTHLPDATAAWNTRVTDDE